MPDQCCGTCRWWGLGWDENVRPDAISLGLPGSCSAPMPLSVESTCPMLPTDGADCPCYEQRKDGE